MDQERIIARVNQTAGSFIISLRDAYDRLGITCDHGAQNFRSSAKRRRHFMADVGAKVQDRFAAKGSPPTKPFGFTSRI